MRYVVWAALALSCFAAGCADLGWADLDYAEKQSQLDGGRAVNVWATDREINAGDTSFGRLRVAR
jgi:hypothetical protein